MNTKINELIAKSTTVEDTYPAGCDGHPVPVYSFDKQKFAELIVLEISEIVLEVAPQGVALQIIDKLCDLLGVEE